LYTRIKRGTLDAEQVNGRWMVREKGIDNQVDNGLVSQLQSEIEYLRSELTETRLMLKESENRKDILLAQMHEKLELITDQTQPKGVWKLIKQWLMPQ
jgi:predicted transcriptional regulator